MGDTREDELSASLDFEDDQTRAQLRLIDDLRKLDVSDSLDLPQLVVVGDQSTGKSSVLQAVTEIPFPVHDSMCTRFATEIVLERAPENDPTTIDISIIPGNDDSSERKETLLKWRPEGTDLGQSLDKITIENIFKQADSVIFDEAQSKPYRRSSQRPDRDRMNTNRLSNATLRITRRGPQETNFAIVDIPGLVRGDEKDLEYQTARKLVEKYFSNPRSIIVVVIDIIDWERHGVFQILRNLPDVESRVIGVINKCDTKQKKSHDFVFDLIRNADTSQSKCYLKAGWYGLRNRQASESDISNSERDKLESAFFKSEEWRSLDPKKLGRHNLKKALIKMRNNHIRQSIPGLLTEIQAKLDVCTLRIEQLGEPRDTSHSQYTLINGVATKYSLLSTNALEGHYGTLEKRELQARGRVRENIDDFSRDMEDNGYSKPFSTADEDADVLRYPDGTTAWLTRIFNIPTYKWIHDQIQQGRATEFPGEVNPEVRGVLWKIQTQKWLDIASTALRKIEQTVEVVNMALFRETCPDERLRGKLQQWLSDDFQKASENAWSELKRIVEEERSANLFTMNPQLTVVQNRLRNSRTEAIVVKCRADIPEANLSQGPDERSHINPISTNQLVRGLIYEDNQTASIFNTHDTLAAYYEVAKCRFIDNVSLQVIERHLLGPHGPLRLFNSDYVSKRLYGDANSEALNELASEDPKQIKERHALRLEKETLERSRRRVQEFQRS